MTPLLHLFGWLPMALTTLLLLHGCGPVLVGGTAVGVSMIHDRRTAATVLEDQKIELVAAGRFNEDKDLSEHARVGFTSYNRVVLITGQADRTEIKDRIAETVQRFPEVSRVVDEVSVGPLVGIEQASDDTYVTSKVKLALFDLDLPEFDPTRIKVVTERGVVYLMGLVTHREAAAVVEKARYINGVQRVVKIFEYVTLNP